MMKQRIQGIIIGVLATLTLISGISAFANLPDLTWRDIRVATGGYNIRINGQQFTATDVHGVIEPFNYNDWIWVPFEHVAVALGMVPSWDGSTRTLSLNSPAAPTPAPPPPVTTPGVNFFSVVTSTGNTGSNIVPNRSYRMGDVFNPTGNGWSFITLANSPVFLGVDYTHGSRLYNLGGRYTNLQGVLGQINDSGGGSGVVAIFLDDRLYAEYTVSPGMANTNISVNVTGVNTLRIEFTRTSTTNRLNANGDYGLANVTIR